MLPIIANNKTIRLKTLVTGPNGLFERIYFYENRSGWKQRPPYDLDLPLVYTKAYCFDSASFVNVDAVPSTALMGKLVDEARNKARAKFVSRLGDASQIGSTLTAELKATYGTVVGGAVTALKAAKLVARGRILEAGKLLGFNPPVVRKKTRHVVKQGRRRKTIRVTREYWRMPDTRMVAKGLANRWLWYSYGVSPLIGDLYNASQVFTREIPGTKVVGKGNAEGRTAPSIDRYSHKMSARVSAYVTVQNPNLWLANQLGLLNPVQWFNEGVMFSFVVDWFSNWSDWIQQLTDFIGLKIVHPCTTVFSETARKFQSSPWFFTANYFQVTRELKIPPVKLQFKYERFQWQRGANAISLLVGFLRNPK